MKSENFQKLMKNITREQAWDIIKKDILKEQPGNRLVYLNNQVIYASQEIKCCGEMMNDILQAQTYPCSQPKICVMTAAREDEVSWGCDTEGSNDEYVYHWTSAIFGKTPTGAVVNANSNGDGTVSVKEAHNYAVAHDSCSKHPQISSCINNACDVIVKVKL